MLYGKLNKEKILVKYKPASTDTADVHFTDNNEIYVDVKKLPHRLKITRNSGAVNICEFDGRNDVDVDLGEIDFYRGVNTNELNTIVDTTANTVKVEFKKTKGKLTIQKNGITQGEFDGSVDKTINIPEVDLTNIEARISANESSISNLTSLTSGHTNSIENINFDIGQLENNVSNINSVIPTATTSENTLVNQQQLNDSITTISSNFRGNWGDFASIPVNADDYPMDFSQSRVPTVNDYLSVADASGYHREEIFTREGETQGYYINGSGNIVTNSEFAYTDKLVIDEQDKGILLLANSIAGRTFRVHAYDEQDRWLGEVAETSAVEVNISGAIPDGTTYLRVSYPQLATDIELYTYITIGSWRFKYTGDWSIQGKEGWEPEYQINETPFTLAQLNAINSGITAELVEKIGKSAIEVAYNNLPQATAESSDMVMLKNRYNKTLGLYLKFEEPDVIKDEDNLIINTYEDVIRQGDTLIFGKKALITEDGDTLVIRVYNNITEEDDTLIFGGEDN